MAIALTSLFLYSCTPTEKQEVKDYTQYVNTFIGAADNGHTFPGACCPFGMIQTSPVTGAVGWRYCSEYVYVHVLVHGMLIVAASLKIRKLLLRVIIQLNFPILK